MGRIVIPMPSPLPRGAAPQASRFRRGEESGVFGSGLGATELQLLSKALDMAVAIGGRIAGAFQRDGEEAPTSAAPAATPRAEAAAQGTTALRAGPAAFLAHQAPSPRPAAPPPTPRVQTPTAAPAVVGGAPVQAAPERLRESPALATYIDQRLFDQTKPWPGTAWSRPGYPSAPDPSTAWSRPGYSGDAAPPPAPAPPPPPVATRSTGYTADIPVYQNPAQYIGELAERFKIPPEKVAALYRQGVFTGRTAGSPFTIPADALAKAGLPRAPSSALPPPPMPPALARPSTPAPMAATPARAPAPGRMPQDLGRIFAAARFIRTREDADLVMKAVAESPDVQPTSLEDLITGNHIKRAQMAVMKYMPRAPAPPTALEEARLEGVRTRTRESELRSDILTEKLNKIQEGLKEDLDKSGKIAKALNRAGDTDSARAMEELRGWSRDYTDYKNRTGAYSDAVLSANPFTFADVNSARQALWRQRAGRFAREDHATIGGAYYNIWPGGTGKKKLDKRNKALQKQADAMTLSARKLAQKRAEASISVETAAKKSAITEGRMERMLDKRTAAKLSTSGLSVDERLSIKSKAAVKAKGARLLDQDTAYNKAVSALIDEALKKKRKPTKPPQTGDLVETSPGVYEIK